MVVRRRKAFPARSRVADLLRRDQRDSQEGEGIFPADIAVGALTFDAIAQGDAAEIDVVRQAYEHVVVIVVEVLQQVEARTQVSVVVDVGIDIAKSDDRIHQVARAERMGISDASLIAGLTCILIQVVGERHFRDVVLRAGELAPRHQPVDYRQLSAEEEVGAVHLVQRAQRVAVGLLRM
jgi:hypothetical protein